MERKLKKKKKKVFVFSGTVQSKKIEPCVGQFPQQLSVCSTCSWFKVCVNGRRGQEQAGVWPGCSQDWYFTAMPVRNDSLTFIIHCTRGGSSQKRWMHEKPGLFELWPGSSLCLLGLYQGKTTTGISWWTHQWNRGQSPHPSHTLPACDGLCKHLGALWCLHLPLG